MNKFLGNLGIFILPILVLAISMEAALRNIPNDYSYKRNYLDKNSGDIEVLFLGSSHAYRAINPDFIDYNSFNAAYVSQSLQYDYAILDKYRDHWKKLKYIVISVSYFSLFFDLETSAEDWRVKNYVIYYGSSSSRSISDYSELLSNTVETNLKRINSYYLIGDPNITSSNLGWSSKLGSNIDLIETGGAAAQRHTYPSRSNFEKNMGFLESIIRFAEEIDAKVVFYTPPAFHTYVENLDTDQLSFTINTMEQLDRDYESVIYVNYLTDNSFTERDFHDADHLNELGAKKFTQKINGLIQENSR